MNYNNEVRPFTEAIAKTKKVQLPTNPQLLDEKARRFLFEMVMSEVGECLLAETEADQIDAICDAAIYITDTCLRFGFEPRIIETEGVQQVSQLSSVYARACSFLLAYTVEMQDQALTSMLRHVVGSTSRDLLPFIQEVVRANNQKIKADGTVEMNKQGKVLKPDNFIPPNLQEILDAS